MKYIFTFILTISVISIIAQSKEGELTGNFQSSFNIFDMDSTIGANESPQYFSEKSSAEAWLYLNYQIKGFNLIARYDLFNNSNLLNPTGSYTGHGLGIWQIKKDIGNLSLTAGSFYEQFGSGLVFRSYVDPLIGLDYAMQGIKANYKIGNDHEIKVFTGNQKGFQDNRFGYSNQIIKGINYEGNLYKDNISINYGTSLVNRTLDKITMASIVNEINALDLQKRFDPKWNVFSYNAYTNIEFKNLSLNLEYVGKTNEAMKNQFSTEIENVNGYVISSTLGYSKSKIGKSKKGGIGTNLQYRKIYKYNFITSPYVLPLQGIVGFVPSLTQQSSYRLLARYIAQAITDGEEALQWDMNYNPNKKWSFITNASYINQLNGKALYRELYIEAAHKYSNTFKYKFGIQKVFYNQQIYQGKAADHANVNTITPFAEATYKFDKKTSLRTELQYLHTKQDFGSFANILCELNISPHYSFAISDMINTSPNRYNDNPLPNKILHFYSVFAKYSIETTSFTAAYIKQVAGVNCSGGVCRLEPAFSGVRFTLTTNF